jgi:hypothetical protein
MRAAAKFVRQRDANDWAALDVLRVEQDAFRCSGVLIGDEADEIAIVFAA